ncbi:efflux RND transporter permease subunit [Pseudoxanthomonas suwonensis]|uniref:Acriflavine resistance protein B n=1 Tax=Pseudoxanthomonas suwonensis TaxID=314722 RepID=A0A0E3UM70_9GAMM|nr:efflux RND transporter permease subunit [Pseudoxanthomonas suwonensis]AKC85785.1 acriflavine resistance protein B [Pseudoxanthomonas suwonensis]
MKFTDIFINKPVLAMVVSLFILLLGLRSFNELNVRQYPELQNAVVTVSTAYYGADADLMQGFVTTPLEREVASAEGIDYLTSTSAAGISSIQAYIRLDHDANEALTQIAAKVNKLRSQLPAESEDPVIDLQQGQQIAAMYVSFASDQLDNNQITDYLMRAVEPRIATIPGVQRADIMGAGTFAMRVWMKPDRMAALGVTASDVHAALQANNVLSALGSTKGQMVSVDLTARTDLRSAEEFRRLIVREQDGAIVRLGEIADVELGSENYGTSVRINGDAATFMGIFVSPDANSLDVIAEVRRVWDQEILPQLPEGIVATIPYDSTESIQDAINEVVKTIIEAVVIVIVVIFLFLGSLRSVIIPAVTVPLSLIGALFLMLLMGFTINLLTLLAMVLAIGIVVDDAIIVLENIHRHIEEGMSPHDAAIKGARELAWPVVAMTTTLVAVYLPIGFQGGLTGVLFTEFAFTLAGAVLLSGIIALTLSPMMCARLLKPHSAHGKTRLEAWLDARFEWLRTGYERRLHGALDTRGVIAVFGVLVLVSCALLYMIAPKEPAPIEDEGFIFAVGMADAYTTLDYVERYTEELEAAVRDVPEISDFFLFNGGFGGGGGASNSAMGGFVLKPWSERDRSTNQVLQQDLQPKLGSITGLNTFAMVPPSLPSAGGDGGGEFLVLGIGSLEQLSELSDAILQKAMESRRFIFLDKDLKIDKPRIEVQIDREKAAMLGIDMRTLAADMAAMLSGGYVNRFAMENRSYRVIPQVQRSDRLNAQQLENYYTRTRDGQLVPLSTLVTLKETAQPQTLKRFQQLNAVGITFAPRPGVSKGEALRVLEQAAAEVLPQGYSVDYAGESRQFKQEGAAMMVTLAFALIAIFLVLAAQFESFRDALIMLITVPMAISGALLVLNALALLSGVLQFAGIEAFPGMSINIYTQVGLVTLIGVIAKHGILIVEFANKLQQQGLSKREAIEQAAGIRLRPVLMTTAALVFAMVPLLIADGPGAAARFSMGMTIASGMTIGTAFTLFVLPAVYLYLARDHGLDRADATETETDGAPGEPEPQPH